MNARRIRSSVARRCAKLRPTQIAKWRGAGQSTRSAIALAVVLGLAILPPIAFLIYSSFLTGRPNDSGSTLTLAHWIRLLGPEGREALRNTGVIAIITTLIAVPVGTLFAWLEVHTDAPLMGRLSSGFLVPLVFSPLLTTIAWTVLAAPRAGLLTAFVRGAGVEGDVLNIYSGAGMVWVQALYFVPISYLVVRGAFRNIDGSVVEAAQIAGVRLRGIVQHIIVPLALPAIGAAILLVFTQAISLLAVVTLLGPTARIPTLQRMAYVAALESPINLNFGAAIACLILVITLFNLAIYRLSLRHPERYASMAGKGFRPPQIQLGRLRFAASGFVMAYLVVAVVLPYLGLVYAAFTPFLSPVISFSNFGLRNFEVFFGRALGTRGLLNTALLAIVGAGSIVVVGTTVAYVARHRKAIASRVLETTALSPLALPGISLAIGLLWYVLTFEFGRDRLYGSLFLIFTAQLLSFLPLVVQMISGAIVQLGNEMEEAARVVGARPLARLRRITMPLLRPAIVSAWLLLALLVSVEAGMSIFLFSPRSITTAVNIFTQSLAGNYAIVYAGAVILATFGIGSIVLGNRLFRQSTFVPR